MRVLIQRVSEASVRVDGKEVSSIGKGLLLLVGIEGDDDENDIQWLAKKVASMRIFDDADGVMNLSAVDLKLEFLAVSQFTLHASTKKGNRPSYIRSAKSDISEPLFNRFCDILKETSGCSVSKGVFGADMKVSLINNGPVTIWLDSKNKE